MSRFCTSRSGSRFRALASIVPSLIALVAAPCAFADLTVTNFQISRYSVSFDISGTVPVGVPGPGENGRGTLRLTRSTEDCTWFDSATGRRNDIVGPCCTPLDWIVDNTGSDGQWGMANVGTCTSNGVACYRVDVGCHPTYPNYSDWVNFFFGEVPAALQPGDTVSGHLQANFGPNVEMINLDTQSFSLSIGCVTIADNLQAPPPPGPTPTLSLSTSDETLQAGQAFTVTVAMNESTSALTGVQLAMHFDPTKLRLDAVAPVSGGPFALEIAEQISNANGTLRYGCGVSDSQSATGAAADLVTLSFTALSSESCGSAALVSFGTVSNTTTKFSLADTTSIAPVTTDLESISIDGTAPVLNNIPSNSSVATDAGSTYGAYFANPGVTVTENCGSLTATLLITYPNTSTASAWPSNGMFPIGTSTLVWSVTDAAGNSASETRTITVANYQLLDAAIALDGPFTNASTRSIRFIAGSSSQLLSVSLSGSPLASGSISSIEVPVASGYSCLSAKDPTHSITDTAAASVSGVRYAVSFALLQGDSNADDVVDIIDFGVFVGARGSGKALDAISNFNSDTVVNNGDFAYLSINFFEVGESCSGFTSGTPQARIRVKDLRRSGRGDLAIADINGDGWVDTADIALYMQGVEPRIPTAPVSTGTSEAVSW